MQWIVGFCAPLLLSLQADKPCPEDPKVQEMNNYYFAASSASGAVGDVVPVEVSVMVRYLPEHRLNAIVIVGCYDEQVAELVADPLYSPEFDSGVYMSFFWRWGEGKSPEALRPGGGLGFCLFGLLKPGGERAFPDRMKVPVATLFFRLRGPPGSVGGIRFCDEEFQRVITGACESNTLFFVNQDTRDLLLARSKHHVGATLTVVEGPATHPDIPEMPPSAKVYPTPPTPEASDILFELSGALASPGAKGIPIDLHVTSALEFSGFCVSLEYPAAALSLARVEEHTRPGIVHIDNHAGHMGIVMGNSRRRVGAEGERVRIATLYFDLEDGAENVGELLSTFRAKHPYMNCLIIQHEGGMPGDLPIATQVEPIHAVQGIVRIQSRPTGPGDVNLDYALDLSDAIALLSDLFQGGSRVLCPEAADVNRDHEINMADPIVLLNHLFRGGPLEDIEVDCMSASR